MSACRVIVIPVSGLTEEKLVHNELEDIQQLVGWYFEQVVIRLKRGYVLYCDEDAKIKRTRPPNI